MPPDQTIVVRRVDADTWIRVRAEAVKRRVDTGELLTEILREWLARQQG